MFRASTSCTIEAIVEAQNVYGERSYAAAYSSSCAILSSDIKSSRTTVRVDSGASRGKGYEYTGTIKLGFASLLNIHDKVTIAGREYGVISTNPVIGRVGCVAYYVIECAVWQSA